MNFDTKINELLVNKGLYSEIQISVDDNIDNIIQFFKKLFNKNIDIYCSKCKDRKTFLSIPNDIIGKIFDIDNNGFDMQNKKHNIVFDILRKRIFAKKLKCPKNNEHIIFYSFLIWGSNYQQKKIEVEYEIGMPYNKGGVKIPINYEEISFPKEIKIMKIGQYPSYASTREIHNFYNNFADKLDKIDANNSKEYKRAMGLNSSEIHIGAFTYMRRIFERIIYYIYETNKDNIDKEISNCKNMSEKFDLVSDYLPDLLKNYKRQIYNILSKGIHELSEKECGDYFPTIKKGIDLIVEDIIKKEKEERDRKEFESGINEIHSNLKNKD